MGREVVGRNSCWAAGADLPNLSLILAVYKRPGHCSFELCDVHRGEYKRGFFPSRFWNSGPAEDFCRFNLVGTGGKRHKRAWDEGEGLYPGGDFLRAPLFSCCLTKGGNGGRPWGVFVTRKEQWRFWTFFLKKFSSLLDRGGRHCGVGAGGLIGFTKKLRPEKSVTGKTRRSRHRPKSGCFSNTFTHRRGGLGAKALCSGLRPVVLM